MSLLTGPILGMPERSGRRVRSWPQSISSYHGPHRNHPGMNNRPVEAAVLRRQSHPIITNLPMTNILHTHCYFTFQHSRRLSKSWITWIGLSTLVRIIFLATVRDAACDPTCLLCSAFGQGCPTPGIKRSEHESSRQQITLHFVHAIYIYMRLVCFSN
jgi:hypothetical protein